MGEKDAAKHAQQIWQHTLGVHGAGDHAYAVGTWPPAQVYHNTTLHATVRLAGDRLLSTVSLQGPSKPGTA